MYDRENLEITEELTGCSHLLAQDKVAQIKRSTDVALTDKLRWDTRLKMPPFETFYVY